MPDIDKTPVTGVEPAGGVTPQNVTPSQPAGGVPNLGTPAAAPSDADALRKQIEADVRKQAEQDIAKVKSAEQSRNAQLQRELKEAQERAKKEVQDARRASMDDDAKAIYDRELERERLADLEEQLANMQAERDQQTNFNNALSFFLSKGVPVNKIVTNEGYASLVESGWNYVFSDEFAIERSKQIQPQPPIASSTPPVLPKAPGVDTNTTPPPAGKLTWEDWATKLGTKFPKEKVFQMFQDGLISADQIPD